MIQTESKTQVFMARFVLVLVIGFILLGAGWYGFSPHVRHRVWQNLIDRPGGQMVAERQLATRFSEVLIPAIPHKT
jgi:hypothetical protein